ncbi:MAG TPA: methyltransferase domain-containing protein [Solirubrobacteraceae bacterium]|nr:methyltransferase domain-containing protein [Solirubrobacteraceae bacterium]
MLTTDLQAFVRASLPEPPLRILEVGAGAGELAAALRGAGYDVTAIDPAADEGSDVEPLALLDVRGAFDAAVAVVSLHHVEPLEQSCEHLATLVPAGAPLVVDEIDADRYDERAAEWWLAQRRARGSPHDDPDAAGMVRGLREHVHALDAVRAALAPWFELSEPVRVAYLHRWYLASSLRDPELELIAEGRLPAVGARFVAVRKS